MLLDAQIREVALLAGWLRASSLAPVLGQHPPSQAGCHIMFAFSASRQHLMLQHRLCRRCSKSCCRSADCTTSGITVFAAHAPVHAQLLDLHSKLRSTEGKLDLGHATDRNVASLLIQEY